MNKNQKAKEINLEVIINNEKVFELEVKGSPELMSKIIEEFNGDYGVIYELKEQLRKYVENLFKSRALVSKEIK